MTVKKEDLSFIAPFRLVANRNDHCHALVAYFDIEFSKCRSPIRFSTGPRSPYTHWKQTVFYLDETIIMSEGEELTGHLTCLPNARNPRDLDITISYNFNGCHSKCSKTQQYYLR